MYKFEINNVIFVFNWQDCFCGSSAKFVPVVGRGTLGVVGFDSQKEHYENNKKIVNGNSPAVVFF